MPRQRKERVLCSPPKMKGFKPYGMQACKQESVKMTYEEFESLRLVNYDKFSHDQAAEEMKISRPTLTRIYNKALQVVAMALVEGKAIEIEGGNYSFDKDWYRCKNCHRLFEGTENHVKCSNCKKFGPDELIKLNKN